MGNYSLQELEILILGWAEDKDLIKVDNAPKQKLKLIEELGELSNAILKNDIKEKKDAIGDTFVVLVILASQIGYKMRIESFLRWEDEIYSPDLSTLICEVIQYSKLGSILPALCTLNRLSETLNFNLKECANLAWNEIKDRKGVTKNGTFIKN